MPQKTVPFTKTGIGKLPNNKPVIYRIQTEDGRNNYTGVAKRGRVYNRLVEHLPKGCDPVPGTKVMVQQVDSIAEAKQREQAIIQRSQPRYNINGKGKLIP